MMRLALTLVSVLALGCAAEFEGKDNPSNPSVISDATTDEGASEDSKSDASAETNVETSAADTESPFDLGLDSAADSVTPPTDTGTAVVDTGLADTGTIDTSTSFTTTFPLCTGGDTCPASTAGAVLLKPGQSATGTRSPGFTVRSARFELAVNNPVCSGSFGSAHISVSVYSASIGRSMTFGTSVPLAGGVSTWVATPSLVATDPSLVPPLQITITRDSGACPQAVEVSPSKVTFSP